MNDIYFLIIGSILYWLINLIILIMGLVRLKTKPESAKKTLIIAGGMFLVGTGTCGMMLQSLKNLK